MTKDRISSLKINSPIVRGMTLVVGILSPCFALSQTISYQSEFKLPQTEDVYSYRVESKEPGKYEVYVRKKSENKSDTSFTTLLTDEAAFSQSLYNLILSKNLSASTELKAKIREISTNLFYQTKGAVEVASEVDQRIEAGTLTMQCTAKMRYYVDPTSRQERKANRKANRREIKEQKDHETKKALKKKRKQDRKNAKSEVKKEESVELEIIKTQVEFIEGFIENVTVLARLKEDKEFKLNGKTIKITAKDILKFENLYPIGFSTKSDFAYLNDYDLYERNYSVDNEIVGWVSFGGLLKYVQNHTIKTRDFSPADQVINLEACSTTKLYKEETKKLIEVHAYTDFVGVNQSKPNGLIQLEIDKEINFNTWRYQLDNQGSNWGFFNNLKFNLNVTKIEQNNRRVNLLHKNTIVGNQLMTANYVNAIDLKNYETYNMGFNLNFFLLDVPRIKTIFLIDFGGRFGRTLYTDSLVELNNTSVVKTGNAVNDGVNTITYFPQFRIEISPESRYGFTLFYRRNFYQAYSDYFEKVSHDNDFISSGSTGNNIIDTFRLAGYFKTNDSKFFIRYSFNSIGNNMKTNFSQLQVGYSFYLFGIDKTVLAKVKGG